MPRSEAEIGAYNICCDTCSRVIKSSQMKILEDGRVVCPEDYEELPWEWKNKYPVFDDPKPTGIYQPPTLIPYTTDDEE